MLKPLASVLLLLCAAPAVAAAASPGPLVSTQWLSDHLTDPKLVVLQIADKASYAAQHIPGARLISLEDISAPDTGGLTLELPTPEALRARLVSLGVSDDSHIVVAFSDNWVTPATRVVFTLDAAGLGARTSLLDGGEPAWEREHRLTTSVTPPPAKPGKLAPLKMRPVVVDAAFVQAHLNKPGYVVVDARAAAFYDGVQRAGFGQRQHAQGHIPGAKSLPFTGFIETDSRLKSGEELQAIFQKAGVKRGDTVVAYCHIGQQATAAIFEARRLGYNAVLYDGAFEDWSMRKLPVENPAAAAKSAGR